MEGGGVSIHQPVLGLYYWDIVIKGNGHPKKGQ